MTLLTAFAPVLEALGRLCREPGGEHLIELLGQQAPTWLVQLPALLSAAELEALQRKGWPWAGIAARLRNHHAEIPPLTVYQQAIANIPLLGIKVLSIFYTDVATATSLKSSRRRTTNQAATGLLSSRARAPATRSSTG